MKNLAFYLVVAAIAVGYNMVTSADRDSTGAIVDAGSVDAFNMNVGDCFDDPTSSFGDEISSLPGVPCADPHDNEVYALVDVTMEEYPGDDAMWEHANDECLKRFESFVGLEYESSALDIYTMYPSPESWKQNDREVVCALYDMNAEKLMGSMQDSGI
jgi:hypothetical protein